MNVCLDHLTTAVPKYRHDSVGSLLAHLLMVRLLVRVHTTLQLPSFKFLESLSHVTEAVEISGTSSGLWDDVVMYPLPRDLYCSDDVFSSYAERPQQKLKSSFPHSAESKSTEMDLLRSKLLHERLGDVGKFMEIPSFAVTGVGRAYNCFPKDRTKHTMTGSPHQRHITILPKCIVPGNPKQQTHVLISTPDGLCALGHNPWNGQSMSNLSGLWWKMLVHRKIPLYWNISHQLDTMACLDNYGVSAPYTPAPIDIESMLAFVISGKKETIKIGTRVTVNETECQSAIPEVEKTSDAGTQIEPNHSHLESADDKKAVLKDAITQVPSDDLPSTGVHQMADAETQADIMHCPVEEGGINASPVHKSEEKPPITIGKKKIDKYSINVTVTDDTPSTSSFVSNMKRNSNNVDQQCSITGVNARIITDIISRMTGCIQQSSGETLSSGMSSDIHVSDQSQKYGQNARECHEESFYEQSSSPQSDSELRLGESSEGSFHAESCDAYHNERRLASTVTITLSSDISCYRDDNLRSLSHKGQQNSPLSDLSTQEVVPRKCRFLSAEVLGHLRHPLLDKTSPECHHSWLLVSTIGK